MTKDTSKPVEDLQLSDIKEHPVWYFVNDDELGETVVSPERKLPVKDISGRLVFDQVLLANGKKIWAMLGNVIPTSPVETSHFLSFSTIRNRKWFHLARYFDAAYSIYGPNALAEFLGLDVDDVFPIQYDIRRYAKGDPLALAGNILKEPAERLTEDQILKMIISGTM
jgi:hypothetical protein